MTVPVDQAPPRERRKPMLPFHVQVALVTLAPWGVFLVSHVTGRSSVPLALVGLFLSAPHVLATVGLYAEPRLRSYVKRNRVALVVAPLATAAGCVVAFAVAPPIGVRALVAAFLLWQVHHFTKQNLGMFVFWARSRGEGGANAVERRLILATTLIGATGTIRLLYPDTPVDPWMRAIGMVAIGAAAIAVLTVTTSPARRLALLAVVAFYAPLHVFSVGLVAAAVTYQVAHGAQYYLMVGHATRPTRRSFMAVLLLVLLGGLLLVWGAGRDPLGPLAVVFGLAKGLVAAHFVADARLWRLRDPDVRAFMKERFAFL